MNKKYTIEDVSWWYANGCDCCDDTYMEAYNCQELLDEGYGTSSCVEDIYVYLLQLNNVLSEGYWESDKEEDYLSESELYELLENNNIKVEVVKCTKL